MNSRSVDSLSPWSSGRAIHFCSLQSSTKLVEQLIKVRKRRKCPSGINWNVRGMIDEHFLLIDCEVKDKTFNISINDDIQERPRLPFRSTRDTYSDSSSLDQCERRLSCIFLFKSYCLHVCRTVNESAI